jgi:SAM-dependent methyltransferase/uncharacterized protein YbaR (Trm112 family)
MISLQQFLETLRCPGCRSKLSLSGETANQAPDRTVVCQKCQLTFPIINKIPRMLLPPLRAALSGDGSATGTDAKQVETALSFGFEWERFPEMYSEWEQQFIDYMQPHNADFFHGKKVLDAGCGNGRFAYYAAKYGAEVWAIDLGPAVEVARRNTESFENIQIVQADLHNPPFPMESFDFIYSIGVLHHLPDPEFAFRNLLRFLKPGGEVQIYLYWKPERRPIKSRLLSAVSGVRRFTTRLPHKTVYILAYPSALLTFLFFVWPYRIIGRFPFLKSFAEELPMKQYARLPFRVCVNDQLDRFSAPIENRYTRSDVQNWLVRASLESPCIGENYGWVATGRKST